MPASKIAGRLDPGQIAQMRRWARHVGGNGGDDRLAKAAQAIVRLADQAERLRDESGGDGSWDWTDATGARGEPPTSAELARTRSWASQITANGASAELKAAAKAIVLLCDDVASFDENGAASPARLRASSGPGGGPPRKPPPVAQTIARWRHAHPLSALAFIVPLLVLFIFFVIARVAAPSLDPRGPASGALVGAAGLKQLGFSIAGDPAALKDARWKVDGDPVTGAKLIGGRVVYHSAKLAEGKHSVEVSFSGFAPWSAGTASWRFTVDTVPPKIQVARSSLEAPARSPYRLQGVAASAESLTVDGTPVKLDHGRFAVAYEGPPAGTIPLVARDAAGNATQSDLTVTLVPRQPTEPIRAVHVSADAWANDGLRSGVLDLIAQKKINAVELDLKDEAGIVGWNASVPLAEKIGAVRDVYDLRGAVKTLHSKGVRVIGRLVAFRDPVLAGAAWKAGDKSEVIQSPDGGPYSGYGGFTNFANEAVRRYNIDIAVAAAKLGVDDILYDYVRRPDGPSDSMVFPGFNGDPAEPVASFLAETRRALQPYGTFLGASVFGIAATRPDEIAQNVPLMAREVDYIAPMLYPSHWGTDEYGISTPEVQPYDIVYRSLQDFKNAVRGTGARLVPWLQDFSLHVPYGVKSVRAQIKATKDAGISEFLLWDPEVTYTDAALRPNAPLPTTGTAKAQPAAAAGNLVTLQSVPVGAAAPVDTGLSPNELGTVPILMYHQLLPDGGSDYDLTPGEFRAELDRLYREGYRPITAADYVSGHIDVPKGATPVVLTFDDGSPSQAGLLDNGQIDPNTAVGILLAFAKTHPGFRPVATMYLNNNPFHAGDRTKELLTWLVSHGFELGNHTRDHADLGQISGKEVQKQFVLEDRIIHGYLPDAKVTTMALPYGVMPRDSTLALEGSWGGATYQFDGVMLVGAEPAPSPFSTAFQPGGIARIRSYPTPDLENGSADWLNRLAQNPEQRYVSDGDPKTITIPRDRAADLDQRYASQAKQY